MKIRLTESQLHRVIKESVKKILRESEYELFPSNELLHQVQRDENGLPMDGEIRLRHLTLIKRDINRAINFFQANDFSDLDEMDDILSKLQNDKLYVKQQGMEDSELYSRLLGIFKVMNRKRNIIEDNSLNDEQDEFEKEYPEPDEEEE